MSIFDDREKGYEKKFQVDQELKFKIDCLAAKHLGEWAATKLALSDADAATYVNQVLDADIKQAAHAMLLNKVEQDFKSKGVTVDRSVLEHQLLEFQEQAHKKLTEKA